MSDRDELRPRPPDIAGEDFLYHLYRGSELLQENRVHAAKAELEQALSLQPSDPKGQDLLGIVYFRLGLYPRAITIYSQLVQSYPDAVEPRINLALCFLKTGQPAEARAELEMVLEDNPDHHRAWGYLGLALQRLGDYERARHAFEAGGHEAMARRLVDIAGLASAHVETTPMPPQVQAHEPEPEPKPANAMPPQTRLSELPRLPSGTWKAIDPGSETPVIPPQSRVPDVIPDLLTPSTPVVNVPIERHADAALRSYASESERAGPPSGAHTASRRTSAPPASIPRAKAPPSMAAFAQGKLLVFPRNHPVALHPSGCVLIQATNGFATRLGQIRSIAATNTISVEPLRRRTRGRVLDEPLGGSGSPLYELEGRCELVLGPIKDLTLEVLMLTDEPLYLREDALIGFEPNVVYENGRLAAGDGDAIAMLQLRGKGSVVVAIPQQTVSIEVQTGRSCLIAARTVVGWVGRLVPRSLPPSEAPGSMHSLVAFTGEGMVLVDGC